MNAHFLDKRGSEVEVMINQMCKNNSDDGDERCPG